MAAITVLIPLYNKALYIEKAIESVLDQSFEDWEFIVVDDLSTDDSFERALSLMSGQNISLIQLPEHVGCAGATHEAVRFATSPICTILDGDDFLHTDSLRVILDEFEKDIELEYMWTRYHSRSETRSSWKEGRSKDLPLGLSLKQALLQGWWGALAQRSFRREANLETGGLDVLLPYAVDQQLAMLFANRGSKVKHLPVVTYYHLQHSKQMSAQHHQDQQRCRGEILRRLGGEYVREH